MKTMRIPIPIHRQRAIDETNDSLDHIKAVRDWNKNSLKDAVKNTIETKTITTKRKNS